MFEFFHERPYLLYSLIAGFFVLGCIGLVAMPKNLFPDSDRPTVVVVTPVPGATPNVVAASVSKPIEQEVSALALVRQVSSTNIAGMSIVTVEFEYEKGLDSAAVDVSNALSKVRNTLPAEVNPSVYTTGSFTLPADVFAVSAVDESLTVADVRKLVESDIKPALLRTAAIGNVEVFGGSQSAIRVNVDPFKLKAQGVSLERLAALIGGSNRDIPLGFSKGPDRYVTLAFYGERDHVEALRNLPIAPNVRLGDVAEVVWGQQPAFSAYLGNGRPAIAVAVQRAPGGSVLTTSTAARQAIADLQARYPQLRFEVADTQRTLIETANRNMLEALRDAIILTLLVIMLFLGNVKAVLAALGSIPMVFFSTIGILWLAGGELNIVVYTAIILALGMLVDDAVVVLENIERHLTELKEDLRQAIVHGTKEVVGPVFAGTVATMAVMAPFLFLGDYPQKIYRPMIATLMIALAVSYVLSITFIPSISFFLYRKGVRKNRLEQGLETLYHRTFGRLVHPYTALLHFSRGKWAVLRRAAMLLAVGGLLYLTLTTVLPLVGGDLAPPMDTGIIKAHVKFSSNETVETAVGRLQPFIGWLHGAEPVLMSSVSVGSEPGVLSLGSGALPTEAYMTINCVNRFERKQTIWEIETAIRERLRGLPNVKVVDVYDFGATPISSIKAPVDTRLLAEDYRLLPAVARQVAAKMQQVKGLTSVSTSWDMDFTEARVDLDVNRALAFGVTPAQIAAQLPLKGVPVALSGGFVSMQTQAVRLYFAPPYDRSVESLALVPLDTPKGPVPLGALSTIRYDLTAAKIERNNMLYSLDVNGYRATQPESLLTAGTRRALAGLEAPGVLVSQEGDIKQMEDTFGRMMQAIAIGMVLLLMALIAIYRSVTLAVIMILVLPLSLIGSYWGMFLFHKPNCMPSMLGTMLLFGILIKNSILLVDFYQGFRRHAGPFEAALESVRVRFRPVFMTAFGTIAGMLPILFERAVGLERLSPLADVAVFGLLVGTVLTLIYVPMLAYVFDRNKATAA